MSGGVRRAVHHGHWIGAMGQSRLTEGRAPRWVNRSRDQLLARLLEDADSPAVGAQAISQPGTSEDERTVPAASAPCFAAHALASSALTSMPQI